MLVHCGKWQIRNSMLYPQRIKWHKHAKPLGNIVQHIQQSKNTIHLYKVKSHAGSLGNECADTIAKRSVENQSGHDIHINTNAHPHSSNILASKGGKSSPSLPTR